MKIGTVELNGRVVLAPMAGVTDFAFRELCRRCGAALTTTEMVIDGTLPASATTDTSPISIPGSFSNSAAVPSANEDHACGESFSAG